VGWRDWSGWDRLDQLDTKAGLGKGRSPEEEAASTRRGWLIFYGVLVAMGVVLAIGGRVSSAVGLVGLVGLMRWLRRPLKF